MVCPWGGEKLFRCGPVRSQEAAICSCNDNLRPVVFKLEASGRENWHETPFSKKISGTGSKTMRKTNQEKEER